MAFLRLANICKEYKISKVQSQKVLNGVSVEFKRGELVAILGESGCGKSTLLNIIGGLDTDYTGSIILQDVFIRDYTEKQMDDYRKNSIGLVFQSYNLISHMTLIDNVEIAMTMSNVDKSIRRERAKELLELVGMGENADKYPNQLSGGQKQRVAIARALANNPSIILADEPTGALDKESADAVFEIFKRISEKGKLVILVTHSQKIADNCSRIITIDDGVVSSDDKKYEQKNSRSNFHKNTETAEVKKQKRRITNVGLKGLIKLSIGNLKQSKSRNLLVSIGMAIGITAVILILCVSSGITGYVNVKLADENSASLVVMVDDNGYEISDKDVSNVSDIEGVALIEEKYMLSNSITFDYGTQTDASIKNAYSCYEMCPPELMFGTLPTGNEVILNTYFASTLTDGEVSSLIGESITLKCAGNSLPLKIVGIYTEPTQAENVKNVFLSDETILTLSPNAVRTLLYVTASDSTYVSAIITDLSALGFVVTQIDVTATEILGYIDIVTEIMIVVGAVSLFVSAIMIFIVLYISVIERTNEIGIIRAIGGRKIDIRTIFSVESIILGIIGGIIGCALALIITVVTNLVTLQSVGYSFISYNALYYLIGFVSCVIISGLSGIAPACYGANLDPVEALRSE